MTEKKHQGIHTFFGVILWMLRKTWAVAVWHPLGRPASEKRHGKRPHLWRLASAVAYRVALMPIFLAVGWLMLLVGLTHPPRQAIAVHPEQFGLSYRNVEFSSADGVKLKGWYINSLSEGNLLQGGTWKQQRPAVVLCHGYGAARDQMLYPLGAELASVGYDVLLMDFRGHGQSGDAPVSFGETEAADVAAAVVFLQRQPGVDPERIGIVGLGMGGYAAIVTAPRSQAIRCVVAVDTYPSIRTMLRRNAAHAHATAPVGSAAAWGMGLYFGSRLLDDAAVEATQAFGSRGLLLVNGANDVRMPARDLDPMIAASGGKAARLVVPDASHGQAIQRLSTAKMIVRYFDGYLQPASETSLP